MNPPATESNGFPEHLATHEKPWSLGFWFLVLTLAFLAHIALIYTLGNHRPIEERKVKNDVRMQLAFVRSELMELQDPTVFAGPHVRGFAASTWLIKPEVPLPTFRWTEPPRLLALATEQLGASFLNQSTDIATTRLPLKIAPPPTFSVLLPLAAPASVPSSFRVTGPMANWKLASPPPTLPLQRAREGLTNSVVQITVDDTGQVFSATLLPPGSGLTEADQLALKLATTTRFIPPEGKRPLTVGSLIFEWQSGPPTNNPSSTTP
jgi:TonB family protein